MARIKLPIKGQTATKSADGECRAIINMRPNVGGSYEPVTPRREIKSLVRAYDHLFMHKTSTFEHRIGVAQNKVFVYAEEANEAMYQTPEPINSIQQIGNTIALICDSTVNHLLYADGQYRFLGELPDLPAFSINTTETSIALTLKEGDGLNEQFELEKWIARAKNTLYRSQVLLTDGGTDGKGQTHAAQGQWFFDAHILRYAYRLFDGSLVKYSPPILLMPTSDIGQLKYTIQNPTEAAKLVTKAFRATLTASAFYDARWKDLIKSVDIYLSPSLQMSSIENMLDKDDPAFADKAILADINLIKEDKQQRLKAVEECGTLYLLKQIPYDSGQTNLNITLLDSKAEEDAYKNLQYGELMPVDTSSNNKVGAKASYVYNNRLHLANLKTTMFQGHNALYFAYNNSYNDSASLMRVPGGTSAGYQFDIYKIIVTLKIDNQEYNVVQSYNSGHSPLNITSLISYPDTRATRIRITAQSDDRIALLCDVPLIPHKYLNVAYYCEPDLHAVGMRYSWTYDITDADLEVIAYDNNKLKVSDINNPFYYPNANTYQIGNHAIIAMGSQAQRISEGSYGQYPLYVFTHAGIYSLQIGQDVLYSNQVAPVSYETPVSEIIAETPYGIIFISARGLCSINGQQVDMISQSIDHMHRYMMIYANQIPETQIPNIEFEEYLKNVEAIIYNPYHDEIYIVNKNSEYSYVYHIPTKSYWMSTEEIRQPIRNTFPELYIVGANAIKTMKESGRNSTRVAIITHPIDFGVADTVKMDRSYLRALLHNANIGEEGEGTPAKMLVNLYSSLDGVNYNLARGVLLQQDGSYKDIDMGLMARTRSKYYMLAIAGTISTGSKIDYIEFNIEAAYNNEKMR